MRIFISSPYRADNEAGVHANMKEAAERAMFVAMEGHVPICPHYAFNYLHGRPWGDIVALYLCCREIESVDEVWVYGEMSEGMKFETTYAKGLGIPVREIEWKE